MRRRLRTTLATTPGRRRTVEADDVVGAILFLTSQDSYFVTGQTIMADGGLVRM